MFKYSYQAFLSKDKSIQVTRMIEEEKKLLRDMLRDERFQTFMVVVLAGTVVAYSIFKIINHLVGGF